MIGIDIAAEPITAARAACDLLSDNCKFYQMDVFRDPSALESVLLSNLEDGPSALFIDIGGEGLLNDLPTLSQIRIRRASVELLMFRT